MRPTPPAGAAAGSGDTERPLVLIVDDNEQNLKLARDVLRAGGLRTIDATTGADGIALAAEHLPDVVLMDLRLPDMDGTEAMQALGSGARTAGIPVVALSSLPLEGDDSLLAAGFAGCLEKPFRVVEFSERVRAFCSRAAR